jgi:hypothetical protein
VTVESSLNHYSLGQSELFEEMGAIPLLANEKGSQVFDARSSAPRIVIRDYADQIIAAIESVNHDEATKAVLQG